ncbi:putative pectate lyase f [Fusarium flagelliforme]|uniref:Pectate lyase n=1 Tax=Fusarium flagelliforme TaxID=2675880 RepID=A0A395MPH3_9HYPO|nr:putative pectate lyase f [Fusarium flagelliforme]
MRTSAFLTIANFGTAFAVVQMYGQCGDSAYSGDKECPSGSACVKASKWYSQSPPQAPAKGGDNGITQPPPTFSPAPEEPVDKPTIPALEESADVPSDVPVNTVTASLTVAPTSEPADSASGSGSGLGGITRTIPSSSGATAVATAIPVYSELDGGMTYYDRSPAVCKEQEETGEADAMFILEDGVTLRNVIIGPGQAEGVHCKGSCTLENVWFEDVCEDAITLKQKSGTSIIRGGGAFHAADKVVQFNGRGTVEISNFYVEDYGKLVRSCGNCKDNGGPQNVVIENIAAVNGGVLCGINTNYGDTRTISNACQDKGKNCDLYEGNSDGSEPTKLSSGPDGTYCKVDSFSKTC